MQKANKKRLNYQFRSFGFAVKGLISFFSMEFKSVIHLIIAFTAILLGLIFKISPNEWCILILTIVIVFISEIINTSIEKIIDMIHPEYHKKAGMIKDLSAGAVLLVSIGAVVIGIIIFLPNILDLFS